MKCVVTVQTSTKTPDTEGILSSDWSDVVTLQGELLPYGNEMALKEYGYREFVTYRFFHKGSTHPALVVGNQLNKIKPVRPSGTDYSKLELPIVYVADYGKAQDVLLNTSGEGKGT